VVITTALLNALACLLLPLADGNLTAALLAYFGLFLTFEITVVGGIPLMTEIVPSARSVVMSSSLAAGALGRALGSWRSPGTDFDLAWLGLLGDGDPQRQHTVGEISLDAFRVEAFAEMHLPAVRATVTLGQIDLVAFLALPGPCGADGEHAALDGDVQAVGGDAGQIDLHPHVAASPEGVHRHRHAPVRRPAEPAEQRIEVTEGIVLDQHRVLLLVLGDC
jgi:hypothetical protein